MTPVTSTDTDRDIELVSRRRRAPTWAIASGVTAVFVGGLVAGGAIVTVTGISAKQSVEIVPSPSPVYTQAPTPSGGPNAQVAIGPGCVRAIDQVQTLYQELQDAASAASGFDLSKLDKVIQQMQQMRSALSTSLAQCNATVQLPNGATVTPTPGG